MINWHNETLRKMKSLSDDSLKFIRIDAYHAYKAFDDLDNKGNHLNPKADQYLDEFYYACQELSMHKKTAKKRFLRCYLSAKLFTAS